jgi:hypothetical protein
MFFPFQYLHVARRTDVRTAEVAESAGLAVLPSQRGLKF